MLKSFEEIKEEITHEPIVRPNEEIADANNSAPKSGVSFNDIDYVSTDKGMQQISAPKNIDRLE